MGFMTLNPWQMFLWIVCLEICTACVVAATVSTIQTAYLRAKEGHLGRIAGAFAKAFEKAAKETMEKLKKKKEEIVNGGPK